MHRAAFQNNGRQRAAIGGRAVDIDAVAVMCRRVDGRVAMHDQSAVVTGVIEKIVAYSEQIILSLIRQDNAGTDARMDKDHLAATVAGWQRL